MNLCRTVVLCVSRGLFKQQIWVFTMISESVVRSNFSYARTAANECTINAFSGQYPRQAVQKVCITKSTAK